MTSVDSIASPAWKTDVAALFQQLLPAVFFSATLRKAGVRQNNRVYHAAVVMWLMMSQRWHHGTLETSILGLLNGLMAGFWPYPCKRLQPSQGEEKPRVSSHPGAFHQACQRLPVSVMQQAFDSTYQQLTAQMPGVVPELGLPVLFVDGSAIRTASSPKMCAVYPPASNQHGDSHWPVIRMLVLHDLITAIAMRPEWGAMYGDEAVSEQALLERVLDRLPDSAVLLGDRNFGVFSVAYATDQSHHPVLLRLTMERAQSLYKGELKHGTDRQIQWKPSRWDRHAHPDLPTDASVSGRLIVQEVHPGNGEKPFLLALFTTLEIPGKVAAQVYGRRWNIETDLRTLKHSLHLDQLTCKLPDMVKKELPAALLAYNLVRAVTYQAAQKAGLTPRDFSFTRVRNVINAFLPAIAADRDDAHAEILLRDMLYYVGQARLPQRKSKRCSYPRAVWPKHRSFPVKHE